MRIPRPGRPVRGSRSGRSVMALLDLLGRRMALRILWELSRAKSPLTFRALQQAADTNPALLNNRLKELRAAMLVLHKGGGYGLSAHGRALVELLRPLNAWAARWAAAQGQPAIQRSRKTLSHARAE